MGKCRLLVHGFALPVISRNVRLCSLHARGQWNSPTLWTKGECESPKTRNFNSSNSKSTIALSSMWFRRQCRGIMIYHWVRSVLWSVWHDFLEARYEEPSEGVARLGAPDIFHYSRDATYVWNGQNHRHCCNSCRCVYCTALRWVVLLHCKCKLPCLTLSLPLDARVRAKRRWCRHLPRYKSTKVVDCECIGSRNIWKDKLEVMECDLRNGNPTGEIPSGDKFISSHGEDDTGVVMLG